MAAFTQPASKSRILSQPLQGSDVRTYGPILEEQAVDPIRNEFRYSTHGWPYDQNSGCHGLKQRVRDAFYSTRQKEDVRLLKIGTHLRHLAVEPNQDKPLPVRGRPARDDGERDKGDYEAQP